MKKLIFIIIAGLIISCTGPGNGYLITGKISGVNDSLVMLIEHLDGGFEIIDSTLVIDGTFRFSGSLELPTRYYIMIRGIPSSFNFFAENSKIDITADKEDLGNAVITGSSLQDRYRKLLADLDTGFTHKLDSLDAAVHSFEKQGDTAQVNKITGMYDSIREQRKKFLIEFFMENNASVISPNVLYFLRPWDFNDLKDLRPIYDNYDKSILGSASAKLIRDWIGRLERIEPGQPVIHFSMNDTTGAPVSPSMFSGKYFLLDMWSPACPPCRKENPGMERMYRKYKDKGFEILGVSFDKDRNAWIQAIKKDGITWTQVSQLSGWNNVARTLYSVESLPANFLIDKDGIIIAKNLRREKLEEKLAGIFEK